MAEASPSDAPLEGAPTHLVDGNRLTLFPEGPARLDALVQLIDGAQHSLRVLFYIYLDDNAGRRVRDALLRAAERGVDVHLLVDGFGAAAKEGFFKPLSDAGVGFCRFVPKFGRRYLLRNHQKLALADESRALVGGFNVADDYFGDVHTGAWRDLGLLVEGPGVACLAGYFDSLFRWSQRRGATIRSLRRMLNEHSTGHGKLHWLMGGPTRRLSPWAQSVRRDMQGARRLDLISAYFAPSRIMLRRICGVARHNRVRIVTAAKSDNNATIGAARHSYWRLLRHGVEVYEYQLTKLHTKLIVIDDVVHIGSANFDMRSLYLNLEMMLRVEDAAFAAAMRDYVDGEIGDSRRITLEEHKRQRSWFNRLKWGIAHFIVAVADYNLSRRLNFGLDGK